MGTKIELTLIISYYKALDNLKLILMALDKQSHNSFEVIVSEDDYNPETIDFLERNRNQYTFPIIHLNQEKDMGFRKNMMLNKSIRASNSENLVFIDGDCIPHRHFVKQYISHMNAGHILWGRRVMLGEATSAKVLANKSISNLHFSSLLFSDSTKLKDAIYSPYFSLSLTEKGMKGCNWGVKKQHLVDINGYDEDYIRACAGEDDDVEWRLKANGLRKKCMKNKAIVYHLHHKRSYSNEGIEINGKLLQQKMAANRVQCRNGLQRLAEPE